MSSNMQKAILVHEIGKSVRLGEREIPTPKAGELLVKVTSAQGMSYAVLREWLSQVSDLLLQSYLTMPMAVTTVSSSPKSCPAFLEAVSPA
jgi:hypothetical protein